MVKSVTSFNAQMQKTTDMETEDEDKAATSGAQQKHWAKWCHLSVQRDKYTFQWKTHGLCLEMNH